MTNTLAGLNTLPLANMSVENTLPADWKDGTFVGRVMIPGVGPAVVCIEKDGTLTNITSTFRTMSQLCAEKDPAAAAKAAKGVSLGKLSDILANSPTHTRKGKNPHLLAPIDLQTVKAAGVTFAVSLVERMIEEEAGRSGRAMDVVREEIEGVIGGSIAKIEPGSEPALKLLTYLTNEKSKGGLGLSHHYPAVGLGKLGEIFTKADTLASVGHGADSGFLSTDNLNNPEPEVVLINSPTGKIVGAALGNDINHRGVEKQSALLLGECKNQRGTCVVGPFIRLFDKSFSLDDVRKADVQLEVKGPDGFILPHSKNSMSEISRDPAKMVEQMYSEGHQYKDGSVLFCGTMMVPKYRHGKDDFTHKRGDIVTIKSEKLGALTSRMVHCHEVQQPEPGLYELMEMIAERIVVRRASERGQGDASQRSRR